MRWHDHDFPRAGAVFGALAVVAGMYPPPSAAAEPALTLPSGLHARLQEALWDADGTLWRLRFVAEGFAPDLLGPEGVAGDLDFLCRDVAVPRAATMPAPPAKVVISLADKPSEFGRYDPSVHQVFEGYRLENGDCVWEMF